MKVLKTFLLSLIFIVPGHVGSLTTPDMRKEFHREKILETLNKYLPKNYQSDAELITDTIVAESTKHQLDPYIVTAVIAGESSYNPLAIGSVGEIGLMQLRPETAEWISKVMKLRWRGKNSLKNPVINIQIGTAYLAFLKDMFKEYGGYNYLAAYNMGAGTVLKHLKKNVQPKIYSLHVMKNYLALTGDRKLTETSNETAGTAQ